MTQTVQRSMLGVIESLESQRDDQAKRTWQELEDHVQQVYQRLLALEGHTILVAKDVCLVGHQGSEYQIDVYYEFELAGVRHRVAIECKNTQRPVERERLMAFKMKIDDCVDIRGIVIAANGYQSGAIKFAKDNKMTILEVADLPSIGKLLGMQLRHNILPTEDCVGAPFWTIYDLETAAPLGTGQEHGLFGVLFWSKAQAAKYKARERLEAKWQVRGMQAVHLFTYIKTVDSLDGRFAVAPHPHLDLAEHGRLFSEVSREFLIKEFCEQYKDSLKVREVMPSAVGRRWWE
jgi:hypothetical protein